MQDSFHNAVKAKEIFVLSFPAENKVVSPRLRHQAVVNEPTVPGELLPKSPPGDLAIPAAEQARGIAQL